VGAVAQQRHQPIPGTKRRRYLEENVAAEAITFTAHELVAIDAIASLGAPAGQRYPRRRWGRSRAAPEGASGCVRTPTLLHLNIPVPPETTATVIRQESSPSLEVSNAYYLSMSLQNIRCFRETQLLDLQSAPGTPARWTLILGENGVGKTTLMQLLVLGSPERESDLLTEERARRTAAPKFADLWFLDGMIRTGPDRARVTYKILWADSLDPLDAAVPDESVIDGDHHGWGTQLYRQSRRSITYGYGANRRRAPRGLTAEASDDPTRTLFDDDATLRNPEEWLLQNELVANTSSPLQDKARRQRERVLGILTRILPGIDEIRVSSRTTPSQQVRASAEVRGPDGWIPFSALGLGYRTMTAWIVDLSSRLLERYGALEDPLSGPAVCLIDEIDLHLHPRWQRDLITRLSTLFPQTQFIATAHSPLIVQAAPDANVVVLRRRDGGVVIDNAPRSVRQWRVDQILTSELFDVPSARAPELDERIAERDAILAKPALTEQDQARLAELREQLGALPQGDTPDDLEAMEVIRRAAKALKEAP
jgi:energy-coupling factor transporter ATP-binding protein EcfA2